MLKKMLAFFGAFNPPTNAHIELAEFAMKETGSEEVIFIPSQSEYILDDQKKNYAFEDGERIYMLDSLTHKRPWLAVCNHDIAADTQPRSYETLCWLRDKYHIQPKLLIGEDQFRQMETNWKYVPEIAKEFGIVVITRPYSFANSCDRNSPFYQSIAQYVTEIRAPSVYKGMSSTDVRWHIQQAKLHFNSIKNTVPPEVLQYIKEAIYEA